MPSTWPPAELQSQLIITHEYHQPRQYKNPRPSWSSKGLRARKKGGSWLRVRSQRSAARALLPLPPCTRRLADRRARWTWSTTPLPYT